ncbi:hypothetical protein FJZ36_10365 [Candidatus Poribacteria bacterium]|nr:hypothetical protein [Candidatus Poribacteria bacterium]
MPYFMAAVAAFLLLMVLLRILRVGCRLIMFAIYLGILILAASFLYSVLQGTGVLEGSGILPK